MSEQRVDELADEIETLAAHISATTCRWLLLIAEFDRLAGWASWGCRSCAHWVSWRCAMSLNAAREHVRVAARLEDLPLTCAAFGRGELSYSKVRALTRLEDVAKEAELLELAGVATAAQLDRPVAAYRGVVAVELGHARAVERRSADWSYDDDGSFLLRCRLPAEEGAVVVAALEAARDELNRERFAGTPAPDQDQAAVGPDEPVPPSAEEVGAVTRADAFMLVADRSLAAGAGVARTGGERYQVIVELDEATLLGSEGGSVAVARDGAALPAETARRICCDATLVTAYDGRSGRRTRTIPSAVRRALRRRDGGCQFPGCQQRRHVDAHHIQHWAHGGRTTTSNLVELCRHHHRLVHEGGYRLERDHGGDLVFRRPDGRRLRQFPRPRRGEPPRISRSAAAHRAAVGSGEALDLALAVDALLGFAPPPAAGIPG